MDRTAVISYDNIENRFLFVLVAAKRALQLQKGARQRVDVGSKKPTVVAELEVLANKVSYQLPATAKELGLTK
jgi:DNA-directed RNA polymerase omega subunit